MCIAGAKTAILGASSFQPDPRYSPVPNLPVPISYPQMATLCLLPLDPASAYAPEIVVFGGSSVDQATADTPASPFSYRVNLAAGKHTAWRAKQYPWAHKIPSAEWFGTE